MAHRKVWLDFNGSCSFSRDVRITPLSFVAKPARTHYLPTSTHMSTYINLYTHGRPCSTEIACVHEHMENTQCWKPGGGPTQFRGDQRSGGGERVVAAFCFCGARGRVRVGGGVRDFSDPRVLGPQGRK